MKSSKILELVKILESHNVSEIEISRWGRKIRITKDLSGENIAETQVAVRDAARKKLQHQFVEVAGIAEDHTAIADEDKDSGVEIKSPIVGTFYLAPAPDADPYVKIGDHISIGQPLCIIEAMKIMNVIESEVTGKLIKMLVDNAQPVEYNQNLFVIEPAG